MLASFQKQKSTKNMNLRYLFFVISSNLLPRCILDYLYFLAKNKKKKKHIGWLLLYLFRAVSQSYWEAVSQTVVPSKVPE